MSRAWAAVFGRRAAGRSERGSVAVELVIVVPGLMVMLGLILAGSRIWLARTAVGDAAYSAARAASLARTAAAGHSDGGAAGHADLDAKKLSCRNATVGVDTAGFAVPAGRPATIHAVVTCDVDLSDLLVPGLPGRLHLRGTGQAALDTYRARR